MHTKPMRAKKRKAISPVIATVILIAITLIASIAIAGFVFGLFGSFTSTAQISVIATYIPANLVSTTSGSTTTGTYSCVTSGSPSGAYIELQDSGTSSASVNAISITFGGSTYQLSGSQCSVSAGGSEYVSLNIVVPSKLPTSGTQFVGTATMSNGAQVPFSGTFQ